ncbi:hypothetical protein M405DRAFT_743303, partial [Rhizopogon salebrosus TDB-379]
AYSFTDYRSQCQTISHTIIDIGTPPTGGLTPFNVYVALSRSHERLVRLDNETEMWWNGMRRSDTI